MSDKFLVDIDDPVPQYWRNFVRHCRSIAKAEEYIRKAEVLINHEFRIWGGKFIDTRTQGMYLRWDSEQAYTMFVLRWS